ncbi:MAG TPA: ATP-binding protein [Piscinibacter sp.]|nr:ATP-binding protein [Piscinibacter sp.]HNW61516.1 ATP-binding protein [Piscinibacter sp.]
MISTPKDWSLRTRLLVIAALASLTTLLAGGAAMYWAAQREDARLLDSRLEDLARTVLSFAEHEITEILGEGRTELMHTETAATLGSRYRYQIWTRHGNMLLHSYKASPSVPMMPLRQLGFGTVAIDGDDFRVFAMEGNGGEMVIQVGECLDERESAIGIVSLYFIGFLLLPFGIVFAITWWLLRRSLRSIDASAAQLSRRSPIDLTPVVAENPPVELKPMISSINALFERINKTLSLERGFTAVAAHELRTPLAGLRAHAQIAATARSPEELAESLAAVMVGVDRAAHLLDQLLDLARMESVASDADRLRQSVDIAKVYESVVGDLGSLASRRGLRIESDFMEERIVAMELGMLLLLRNLLGNAIRYTPTGGRVNVSTRREGAAITLTVDDSGPGIPLESRERVFERFDRLGAIGDEGVGLGMSIVQSVVVAHQAMIRLLESPLGGLRVQVHFPLNRV